MVTHYLNFQPCEAVQWMGGTFLDLLVFCEAVGGKRRGEYDDGISVEIAGERHGIFVGDWLVKHLDGTVTVQDEEPPSVERWEWSNSRYDGPVRSVCSEYDAREFHDADPEKYLLWRRPGLNNGWTGPWEEETE